MGGSGSGLWSCSADRPVPAATCSLPHESPTGFHPLVSSPTWLPCHQGVRLHSLPRKLCFLVAKGVDGHQEDRAGEEACGPVRERCCEQRTSSYWGCRRPVNGAARTEGREEYNRRCCLSLKDHPPKCQITFVCRLSRSVFAILSGNVGWDKF